MSRLRPTKDIDFLGTINPNEIDKIFLHIGKMVSNDGVVFDVNNLSIERITQENEYKGFRVKFDAYLGSVRKRIQIDIGFGDVIVPKSLKLEFPTLLDLPAPIINLYTKESFKNDKLKQDQWMAFLNRNSLQSYNNFSEVIEYLQRFIEPVCSTENKSKNSVWKLDEWTSNR